MNEAPTRIANWAQDQPLIKRIRHVVFVEEQGVTPELEWDGKDPSCTHALARGSSEEYVATGRLEPDGKIGRMAVLSASRGQGLGRAILDALLARAQQAGLESVYLHAQTHAMGFYSAAGFVPEGPEFDEAGIPHRLMRYRFAPVSAGETRQLTTASDYARGVINLLAGANGAAVAFTPQLEPSVYSSPEVVEAIRLFALRNSRTRLRVLVCDPRVAVQGSHRLIELSRRLSSFVTLRVVDPDFIDPRAFFVAAGAGFVLRDQAITWSGIYDTSRPSLARQLEEQFDRLWGHSLSDPQLRRLHL